MRHYSLRTSGSIKNAVILFVFAIVCGKVMAQSPDTSYMFQKIWGGTGQDYPYDAHIRPDGGYILGGVSTSFPGPAVSCWVMRVNYKGDTLWTTSYGGTGGTCDQQYINDICENSDGGSIAVGGKTVCGNPNVGGDITRLDSSGNILWTKYCSASADPYPVIQTNDGNFITGGYLTGLGAGGNEGFLMKLDPAGDTIWSKTYGGTGDDWFYHILQTRDGGYLTCGKTTSFGQGLDDIYLVKTDANGNVMWSKAYGTSGEEVAFGHALQPTTDGGYILTGQGDAGSESTKGIFLLKIDSLGNMSWAKYYNGMWGHTVKQTPDGGFAIAGTGNYGSTSGDIVLIKTDASGNVQWSKAYGGSGPEQGLVMELAKDGGYLVGGYTISFGAGGKDMYLIKTDANGNSGCNETNPGVTSSTASFIVTNATTLVSQGPTTVSYSYYVQHGGAILTTGCSAVLPYIYTVTGGGTYCSGGSAVAIGLSGSQTGVNYQLMNGGANVGSPVAGTGSAISFVPVTVAGSYSVAATFVSGTGTVNMNGGAHVVVSATASLPVVSSVSPVAGYPASSITITGTGFNTTPSNNIVYFGATSATVTAASSTSLTVTVPVGATYMPVSVENMGCNPLSGYSGNSFLPTYNNGAFAGDSIGFAPIYLLTGTTSPNMVTIFDVDGDGKPDLVVPGYSATLSSGAIFIYRNMSTSGAIDASSFPSYVAIPIVGYSNIQQVAMGDLDGDGKPDMAIADYLSGYMSVLRNTSTPGSISFSRRGDFYVNSPLRVSIADINGDGKPDVIVCNGNVNIFQNIATEGYLDSSSLATNVILSMHTSAYDVKEADMDGDGHTDLVTCNYNNTITVFHNMGYSSISVSSFDTGISFHTAYTPHNIAIGDLDGDGKPDVAVSNNGSNRLCVYRNTTTGGVISFADTVGFPTGYSPETVAIGDFDGDGKPDLAVQDNEYTMSVYRNTSSIGSITNTSFATRSDFPIAGTPSTYFLAVGDLDGDGRPDFVASNTDNNTVSIYRNVPKPPVGTISGPSLICIGSPMTLSNDSTGGTWSSSNTGIATIGSSTGFVTGVAPGIDTISYRTISGGVSKLTITVNVAPGAITGNLSICAGNNTLLSDSPAGGNWFSSNTAIATVSVLSPGVITGVSAGTTAISYMNSCGFVSTVLTVNALPSAAPVNNGPMCNGGSVILFAMPSGGANTYSWSGPGGIISTSQNPIVSPTTTVTYSLTVTNGTSGCTSSGYTTLVSVNPTPYAAPTNSGLVCGGGSVTLSANPGAGANTYAWSGPGGFSSTNQNPVIAPTVSGTYSLTVSSAAGLSGCSPSTIYSTFVAVNPSPTGTFTVTPDPLCTFSTATLTATYPTCAGNAIIIAGVPSTSFGSHTGVITTATDNVTLEAWVKWNGTGGIQTIISNGENSGGSAAGYSITVQDGVIQCYVDGVAVMNVTGSLPSGQWSHVALSRTSGIWKFYLNGANAALTNNTATPIMPAGNFYVGSIGSSLGTFDGAIDEVKVWNVGRTGSQINADMNACSTGAQTGLAGYWGFNEGAGTNAADGSGNGNDLTLTDVAWTTSGAIPNVYSIRSGDGATFTGVASQAYAYNTSGIYTASVTVTNGSGCSTMATAPLTVLDPPVFISGNMGLCLGDSTSLIEYATGGTWSSSNNAIATVNSTGVVTSVATGYDTVIYANGCGSPATATISVGLPVTGVYSVNPNPLCPGTTATLTATFSSCSGDAMAFTGSLSDAFHAGVVTTVQDNLTIEAWVKWNGTTGVQTIVENGSTGSDGYQLAINNGNVVCYLGGYLTLTSSVNLTAYQWEHVALVRNSGIWTLYHNGLSNSVTNNTATPFMPSGNFTIGSNSTSYQGFVGEIDEVKIWNVARGGTEVNFDMNACSSGPQTGLVGYWSFNEGSGTTAADGSGNGNTLTTDNISWSASGGVQNTYEFWPGEGSFISGNSTENHTYNTPGTFISYVTVTSAAGCSTIVYDTVTVTGPATNIAGNANVCVGATTLLADGLAGGSWHSGNTSVATIDTTGTVTGITAGTTLITYLVNNSCGVSTAYVTVTVNPITSAGTISGILTLCVGGHTSLSDTSGSGYWGSENGSVASVNSDGNVFGYTVGTATITLTRVGYCGGGIATAVVTVSAASAGSITGPSSVNVGSSITLTDVVAGGVWSASNADVTVFGGLVTGAAAGSVTISYTTTGSCAATSTKSIIVNNASIGGITGIASICAGTTAHLSDTATGGTWSSSNVAVATIGGTTGIITGVAAGTTNITYTLGGAHATIVFTVNGIPLPVQGVTSACAGSTAILTDNTPGGTWSSAGDVSVVTTGTNSGTVTEGASAGTGTITYTLANGCYTTYPNTALSNPSPIFGSPTVCVGNSTILSDSTATGVSWTSSNTLVATVLNTGHVTGVSAGSVTITYKSSPGNCIATQIVSVVALPASISGNGPVCAGSTLSLGDLTGGGVWSSSNAAVATVGSGSGIVTGVAGGTSMITYTSGSSCITTAIVTINPILPITGAMNVCTGTTTTLSDASTGGAWISGNTGVATVGLSNGLVTGVGTGSAVITYSLTSGCSRMATVNVGMLTAITGSAAICVSSVTILNDATAGGVWSSSNTLIATVGSSSGSVTAAANTGTVTISYSIGGCIATRILTVNANPLPVQGAISECAGTMVTLTDNTPGGTWSVTGDAAIGTTGILTAGASAGTATVTYTLSTGCHITYPNTIIKNPSAIFGSFNVCQGAVTILSDSSATGVSWASSNTLVATVPATGHVTGVAPGTATITYKALPGNCIATQVVTVNAVPVVNVISASSTSVSHTGTPATLTESTPGGVWSSSHPTVIALSGSTGSPITATAMATSGSSVISYAVTNTAGCITTLTTTLTATPAPPPHGGSTGVDPLPVQVGEVSLYPNPTNGSINIRADVAGVFYLYSLDGKALGAYKINEGVTNVSLPNELATGIYMGRYVGEDGNITLFKIVKE